MPTEEQKKIIIRGSREGLTGNEIQKRLKEKTGKGIRRKTLFKIIRKHEKREYLPEQEAIKYIKHTPTKYLSKEERKQKKDLIELEKEGKKLEKEKKKKEAAKKFRKMGGIIGQIKIKLKWKKWAKRKGWWIYYEIGDCDHSPPCRKGEKIRWKTRSEFIHSAVQKPSKYVFEGLQNEILDRKGFLWKTRNWRLERVK